MPKSIDKGDVDISKLFEWKKNFDLEIFGRKITIYLRLVGDAEINRARVYALRKSAELRKKLRDKNSDEYIAFIPDFDIITKEELLGGILTLAVKDLTNDAIKEVKIPLPVEPTSDASLEEQEKYQEEIDNYPILREELIRNYVKEKLQALEDRYKKLSKENLYDIYVKEAVNQLCEMEMISAFREMSAYFGSYKDKNYKTRLVNTFEEFQNLPSNIKTEIIQEYLSLEIDGEVLKKLPEVTQ